MVRQTNTKNISKQPFENLLTLIQVPEDEEWNYYFDALAATCYTDYDDMFIDSREDNNPSFRIPVRMRKNKNKGGIDREKNLCKLLKCRLDYKPTRKNKSYRSHTHKTLYNVLDGMTLGESVIDEEKADEKTKEVEYENYTSEYRQHFDDDIGEADTPLDRWYD
jgi:hypothetical protein